MFKEDKRFRGKLGKGRAKPKKKEENMQISLSRYIKNTYPDAMFCCDIGSGLKLTMRQAVNAKKMRSSRGMPDIPIIYEARRGWAGLVLELKSEYGEIYKEDGSLKKKKTVVKNSMNVTVEEYDHHQEQAAILQRLKMQGYLAIFGAGLEHARRVLDWYMSGPSTVWVHAADHGFEELLYP